MSDDENSIVPGEARRPFWKSWGDQANSIARRRAVEEGNKLRDAAIRATELEANWNDAKGNVLRSEDRLKNINAYTAKERAEVAAATEQLEFKQKELKAKSEEIAGESIARKEQHATLAEKARLEREHIEMQRAELQQKRRRFREGLRAEMTEYEARLAEIQEQTASAELALEKLLDPSFDGDETAAGKRRLLNQQLAEMKTKSADYETKLKEVQEQLRQCE